MKVLMQNRPDAFASLGGDTIQMLKTAEHLRRLGVNVDVSTELNPRLDDYDVVHLMNITRVKFTHSQLLNAKKHKKKVVLSTIYWNTQNAVSSYLFGALRYLDVPYLAKNVGTCCVNSFLERKKQPLLNEISELLHNKKLASTVLKDVDCLLPNSQTELDLVKKDFVDVSGIQEKEAVVVPNGVDSQIFYNASPKKFVDEYGLSDFILCVGRFGFRKNQLSLIKALNGSDVKTVFIGNPQELSNYYLFKDSVDRLYYRKCKHEADSSFIFLPSMSHDELASAYAACKVFVLPSFYETPGLVALEAALAGANIAITSGGSTKEYFLDYAHYFDPYEFSSIKHAVFSAYESPNDPSLKQHVLNNYTWDHVARVTLTAYEAVMKK